jgi:hypothetical protein
MQDQTRLVSHYVAQVSPRRTTHVKTQAAVPHRGREVSAFMDVLLTVCLVTHQITLTLPICSADKVACNTDEKTSSSNYVGATHPPFTLNWMAC